MEVETSGGVVYEVEVPTTVLQRLPGEGEAVRLRTVHVVREDSAALYGFLSSSERELFRRLMTASGVGAKLALAMLSAYTAPRLAQALAEKDTVALQQVSGVGKKTAELQRIEDRASRDYREEDPERAEEHARLALELADKVSDLALTTDERGPGAPRGVQEAVAALVALGYSFADADEAVRAALSAGDAESADTLIRRALSLKGGSP